MKRNLWKRCAMALACCVLAAFPLTADAAQKELPTVNWAPNVFTVGETSDESLLSVPGTTGKVASAITERLETLSKAGKLPFALKTDSAAGDLQTVSDDTAISIQPFSVLDASFDSQMTVNGKNVYHALILSALDVSVVSRYEEDGKEEYRMLGMVPLHVAGEITQMTPITAQQKADKYAEITQAAIASDLDFSKNPKLFKNLEERMLSPDEDTWQVSDVAMSSKKAQTVYGSQQDKLRRLVAAFAAASFQQATSKTVLPSPIETGHYAKSVEANMNAFTISSALGKKTLTIPQAKHQIALDICGVNSGVMDEDKSDVLRHVMYKAWLRARPAQDAPGSSSEKTLDANKVVRESKTENVQFSSNPIDIYSALYIDLSTRIGSQVKAKK